MAIVSIKDISSTVDISPYKQTDVSVISHKEFSRLFGDTNDYVEQHIYTTNGTLLLSDYDFKGYTIPFGSNNTDTSTVTKLEFDPGKDLQDRNLSIGTFVVQYNILRKKIVNKNDSIFFIKEISSDRKELRIVSNVVSNSDVESGVLSFINEIQTSAYYKDFLLNFKDNKFITGVNIALDKNTSPVSILIKLYEPLSKEYDLNSTLFIVEELSSSYAFQVELAPESIVPKKELLAGPNFNIKVDSTVNSPSEYFNIEEIFNNNNDILSYQKIINKLNKKNISINIDYSEYSNYVHFSSARERLTNFVYKLQLLEIYQSDLDRLKTINHYSSSSFVSGNGIDLQNKIDTLYKNFDGYENYLYHESSSFSWPKSGSSYPYVLYNTTSSEALTWLGSDDINSVYYGGQITSASLYDSVNQDNLIYTIPSYILNDERNKDYSLFINMIGQHYDTIWTYIKAINNLYKNTNSLKTGISKDLVAYALKSFGIKLYNSKGNDDMYSYLLGSDSSGSYVKNAITASNDIVTGEDQVKELYKRLYHNLPYLLKSKGTNRGLKALISTYGISDTVLDIIEYGGSDKSNKTYEYNYNRFTYTLDMKTDPVSTIEIPWGVLNQNINKGGDPLYEMPPDTIEFRIKPIKGSFSDNQTVLSKVSSMGVTKFYLNIEHSASNDIDYANFNFIIPSIGISSSIQNVPFWNIDDTGDTSWWNIMLRRRKRISAGNAPFDNNYYDLYIKNKIDNHIGFEYSSSINVLYDSASFWYENDDATIVLSSEDFSYQIQEFRYWSTPLSESAFNDHVMDPSSISGNTVTSSYYDLAARFTFGNNLYTYNHNLTSSVESTHPDHNTKITGDLNSVILSGFSDENNYSPLYEEYYSNINAVYSNPTTEKIHIIDNNAVGDVLLVNDSIENNDNGFTNNQHFSEISFSPSNDVNKDIINQFGGNFDIDNFIGNPEDLYKESYSDLDNVKKEYFKKYIDSCNYTDYVRLLGFFDNSLFKMIEDFVPSRTNINTGLTIKSNILERNKIKNSKPIVENNYNCFEADYEMVSISTDNNLDISGSQGIYGELDGSEINIHSYIVSGNHNPYALFKPDFDQRFFDVSEDNVELGVVYEPVTSDIFYTIDNYDNSILNKSKIQDYNYNLQRSIRPRYEGSKMYGSKYNEYTVGDISYGKNPVIERRSGKIGWVKNIPSSSLNFYDKTIVNLKYLVDSSSSLLELSKHNKNLFEVQNTFKSGDDVVLSISNTKEPSIQTSLDGAKKIWKGGFSYDPIIYRENNESLTFKFDEPISQSISYLGFKSYCNDSYKYYTHDFNESARNVQPSNNPNTAYGGTSYYSSWVYEVNKTITNSPMSYAHYANSDWRYSSSLDLRINYTPGLSGARPGPNGSIYVYSFNLLKFNDVNSGYNTEGGDSTFTPDFEYIYKVPRTGNYKMRAKVPFIYSADGGYDHGNSRSAGFKFVGIVEKTQNPSSNDWKFVSATTLSGPTNIHGIGNYASNSNSNTLIFTSNGASFTPDSNWGKYVKYDAILDDNVSIDAGWYLRFQVHIIDTSNIFGNGEVSNNTDGTSARSFNFFINGSPIDTPFEKAFIEIYDESTPILNEIDTVKYGQVPQLFTTSSLSTSNLIFDKSVTNMFISASMFTPVGNTKNYYTSVVDYFDVQKHDLIRIGPFKSPKSKYYEIVDSYFYTIPPVSITGTFTHISGGLVAYFATNKFEYNLSIYGDPNDYFRVGDIISISGTGLNDYTTTITSVNTDVGNNNVIIYFAPGQSLVSQSNITATFTHVNNTTRKVITLDRPITESASNISQNFAVLRQKEDETGVILDYRKQLGDVAQSVLIPVDSNNDIKNNVGDIYKKLNITI